MLARCSTLATVNRKSKQNIKAKAKDAITLHTIELIIVCRKPRSYVTALGGHQRAGGGA